MTQKQKNKQKGEEILNRLSDNITPVYMELARSIKRGMCEEQNQEHYSKELMDHIHDSWLEMSTRPYIEMTLRTRRARRKIRS